MHNAGANASHKQSADTQASIGKAKGFNAWMENKTSIQYLNADGRWFGLGSICRVKRILRTGDKVERNIAYYISKSPA